MKSEEKGVKTVKIYIVTGANGFLGNTVVKKLPTDSEIRALILPGDRPDALVSTGCKIYEGDVTKPETLKDQLKPILSNEKIFFTDLYKNGLGEKIEGFFREMITGKGAVKATIYKYS